MQRIPSPGTLLYISKTAIFSGFCMISFLFVDVLLKVLSILHSKLQQN
jgi:hypothetical protein